MIDHTAIQLALRARLLTLSVCTTGLTSLSATATGYARAAGSFVTDGFAPGMEVTPSGFPQTAVGTITAVTTTDLTIDGGRTSAAVAGARALTVGLPAIRAWENTDTTPPNNRPYVEEQYLPGSEALTTDGFAGLLELRPMYSPRIYVPANTGISADGKYADAIRRLFRPGTTLAVGGDPLVVRGDVAPFRGQRLPGATPGWSCIPITIPLRVTTVAVPA